MFLSIQNEIINIKIIIIDFVPNNILRHNNIFLFFTFIKSKINPNIKYGIEITRSKFSFIALNISKFNK